MNPPVLADKQGTPARPTRGLLDTTLDSQNQDRRLAIVGAWLAFMIGLAADGTVDSPASFGVAGTNLRSVAAVAADRNRTGG